MWFIARHLQANHGDYVTNREEDEAAEEQANSRCRKKNHFRTPVTEDEEIDWAIRLATRTGRLGGSENFIDKLEFQLHQPLKARRRGEVK